jgi:hypothetical protein
MAFKYARGAIAWFIVCKLNWPLKWSMGLLPWAGDYAYWNDPWVRWCREANYRALDLDRPEPFA